MKKMVKKIAVTGAGGQIAYSLLFRICVGEVFGKETKISLRMLDLPAAEGILAGVAMELEDCAFPLLEEIHFGSNPEELFEGVDCAFLVGAKPRGVGMERSDLLSENGKIFIEMGRALNLAASKDVKVLVVGNPCNTNCLICMENAPAIPRKNFHALMRLDENRARGLLAKKAGVNPSLVKGVVIWGNHSTTQVPDYTHILIGKKSLEEVIDAHWLQEEFTETVQKRGSAVIKARGKSSAASAASASVDAMRALFTPTPSGEWFTSAVLSDDNPYGIEKGLIFGFPCRSRGDGEYEIVPNLPWNYFISEKIAVTQKELLEEREMVRQYL